jgi:hypothetical protein
MADDSYVAGPRLEPPEAKGPDGGTGTGLTALSRRGARRQDAWMSQTVAESAGAVLAVRQSGAGGEPRPARDPQAWTLDAGCHSQGRQGPRYAAVETERKLTDIRARPAGNALPAARALHRMPSPASARGVGAE